MANSCSKCSYIQRLIKSGQAGKPALRVGVGRVARPAFSEMESRGSSPGQDRSLLGYIYKGPNPIGRSTERKQKETGDIIGVCYVQWPTLSRVSNAYSSADPQF